MANREYYLVPEELHNSLVSRAFTARGYQPDEVTDVVRFCVEAARHGIHTHNAIKALHLDALFGSRTGGCIPGAIIQEHPIRFAASRVWNANRKLGPSVSYRAIETAILSASQFGVGIVSVDNAFHYFWGGAYVLEAARRGYIAYTQCTAMLAEVVPFRGRTPTLGTNPHTWAFPTTEAIGFPVLVDFATSTVAMGRVQQLRRENGKLPPRSAINAQGEITDNPAAAVALLPFGEHKGYGLGLVNELIAATIGGSLPTVRGRHELDDEKHTPCFFFLVCHPEAMSTGAYAKGRSLHENLLAVLKNILGPGNENAILPGQLEAEYAAVSKKHHGLLFTQAEIHAFAEIAEECGATPWQPDSFHRVTI